MKKTVMKMPIGIARQPDPAEAWVHNRDTTAAAQPVSPSAEPMKRFTIDVSEGLHKRIKMQCASRSAKMADVIRELLEREFPSAAS